MRVRLILFAAGLLQATLAVSLKYHNSDASRARHQRALTDLLGGFDGGQDEPTQAAGPTEQVSANTRIPGEMGRPAGSDPFDLFPPFTTASSEAPRSKDPASTTKAPSSSATSTSAPPPPTPPPPPPPPTSAPSPAESPHASATAAPAGGAASSAGATWKIIGVAVITFSVVAAILLASVFFDYWWGFVRDALGRRRAPGGDEELVPDWEKASWEVRFGDDRHRYPSFTAPPPLPRTSVQLPAEALETPALARNRSVRSAAGPSRPASYLRAAASPGPGLGEPVGRNRSVRSTKGPGRPASYTGRQAASPGPGLGELRSPRSAHSTNVNPFEPAEPAETDAYGGMAER